MTRFLTYLRSPALAVAIGVAGAFALCHWSVCEQDDRQCAFTGDPR